jgi:hypothetical protein
LDVSLPETQLLMGPRVQNRLAASGDQYADFSDASFHWNW